MRGYLIIQLNIRGYQLVDGELFDKTHVCSRFEVINRLFG